MTQATRTFIGHDNKDVFVRHRYVYVCESFSSVLISQSEKTENVSNDEVDSDFKKRIDTTETKKKDKISHST